MSYRPYTKEMVRELSDTALATGLGVLAHQPGKFSDDERFILIMEAVLRLDGTVTGFGDLDFEHGAKMPRYGSDELD